MKRNYTISSVTELSQLHNYDTVQFTLNGRISPDRRRVCDNLNNIKHPVPLYVHTDFMAAIPRLPLFSQNYCDLIIEEIADILNYSIVNPNVKGVVIHMDNPFRQEIVSKIHSLDSEQFLSAGRILQNSSKAFTEAETIALRLNNCVTSNDLSQFYQSWYEFSIKFFLDKLNPLILEGATAKVYLENSTKNPKIEGVS